MVMGLVTILWEITFSLLCWSGRTKWFVLAYGVVFHWMTSLLLGLTVFPLICLSMYWAFADVGDVQRVASWCRRQGRRWRLGTVLRAIRNWQLTPPAWGTPGASLCGFVCLCAVSAAVSIEAERRMDIYGRSRPEGPVRLAAAAGRDWDSRMHVVDRRIAGRSIAGLRRRHATCRRHVGERALRVCAWGSSDCRVPPAPAAWRPVGGGQPA